jgi:hypothetical protein
MIFWDIIVGAVSITGIAGVVIVTKVRYHGLIRGTAYDYRPYIGASWRLSEMRRTMGKCGYEHPIEKIIKNPPPPPPPKK